MADSIPICDVLTEAMTYLTKLGTNIRIRSENLRDKRIRKDKLRNTHAIHKAVDKVLLICELSKKSIENVENGVKSLLSQMEKAGATFGPGPKARETSEGGVKFEYFTYESRKLKIRDKISVGHYTSVKVVSKSMTLPMIEKYPVYHDCKLYRLRRRKKEELHKITSECVSSDVQNLDETKISCIEDVTYSKEATSCEVDHKEIAHIHELKSTDDKSMDTYVENVSIQLDDRTATKDGSESRDQVSVNEMKHSKSPDLAKDESNSEPKPKKRKMKKFKHIKVIDSDSSSDNEMVSGKTTPCNETSKNDSNSQESSTKTEENKIENETLLGSETKKPLIKCVSLTKLLKPEIVKKIVDVENKEESIKFNKDSKLKRPHRNSKSEFKIEHELKNKKTSNEIEDEDAYWSHKREEVKNFKPKKFNVHIPRLSKITPTLLEKYSLKKVTHMGSVVCELLNDSMEENSNNKKNNETESNLKRMNATDTGDKINIVENVDVNKVKNSLLYDSDSDNAETSQNKRKSGKVTFDKSIDEDSCSAYLKNNGGEERELHSDKQNEESREKLAISARSNEFESIEKETEDLETEIAETTKDALEKLEQFSKTVNNQNSDNSQNQTEINQEKLQSSESDNETRKLNNNIKKVKKKNSDRGYKSRRLLEKSKKLQNTICDSDESNDPQNSFFEDSESKLKESDSEQHTEKKQENSCRFRKSLLADSDSESQNVERLEENNVNMSLLYESDFEPHNETEPNVSSNVKNALLADSDCETQNLSKPTQDKVDKYPDKPNEVCQKSKSPLHESDCDSQNQKNRHSLNEDTDTQENLSTCQSKIEDENASDPEIIKSKLLKDSSDDISNTPKKQSSHSGDSPPQSKRKHMRESMYAKKMLLTYSSSSDTEDEQLRNTLKEIRDCLLKGGSSDEDINNKKNSENDDVNDRASVTKTNSSKSESEKEIETAESNKRCQSDSDSKETSSKEPVCGSDTDISSKPKVDRTSATPDDSCSQKSDIQDDKEIDGLTNLESLKKSHRRRKPSTRQRRRMAKASGLISNEGFLEAESSSDAASLSGSDHADNVDPEDIPRVKLTDINGDGIEHLAKDDLLGESDTSVSHDEKKNYKKEDDTDEENVKSKRRKAIAISSDSEAGSSRRKENNFRLSDFEDSEDENSEPVRNKRKKKISDSDASGGSSDDGKKKRRRIKTLDESEGSGSDTENEGRNKHGRKNIRKVMGKNQLEEATKKAAREEKERIARIAERQKLYNNLEFDESGKPDEVVLEKVVLDFDPETKEPLIQVDRGLVKKLKPHQANGIKFMWDACFESVKRIKKDKGSGCILAHCMGLGKTLQVVSLTHTLLTHGSLTGVRRVLVVCPLSTVLNWVNEFRMWLKHAEADFDVDVYELSKFKQNSERSFQLSQWFEHGGVCVLGYEMFRNLSADKGKKFKKKILKNFQESLVDPGPDLVVCDEGHLLKNEKTSLSQSMNRVKTRRRIVLTGTPLQNNLKEYYCMVQFVKPNLLGKYNEYLNRFVNPITNGQYTDSTEHDIRVMKRRSHVLHKMLDGAVQRRDYGVLAPFLPPKHEYVLFITLTDVQIKLYHHYLDNYSRRPQPGKSSGFLFPDFQSLQRIWTHPLVLKYNSERYEIMQQKKREREEEDSEGSLVDFIDDDSTPDESSTEESSDDLSDGSDDSRKKSKKKKSGKKGKGKDSKVSARRGTRANPIELDDDEPIESLEVKSENPTEWWMKLVNEEELEDMRNSHKLILLFDILRQCEAIGDKLLVFSQSLYSLDLIEHFLGKVDEATQAGRVDEKLGGHVGSWSPGVDYFRLDGSSSCENRSIWCKNFNRIDNQRARLFLISTRAGGLGINLVAANRVVIFDVSWNPSHDVQSIFRVYRFGQKKPCYVYRFLAMGTMEEKIYERQVTKQAISKRVIDEQQIDRHYAENDLAELYKFEPQPPQPRPLPPLPKDRLFAEMLKEHEAQIYKYHEHDSLLENKEEETLSEEERRAAWEDFENEKTRPPPQPFLSPYAMHNGMVQGLLAQQQQMAMATISAMLRKDMPNMTDQQLRETVPLILASNPGMFGGYDYGLMQKMSEIYKYAQPGMMNPGMMNPMNAGGGMSGASGLGASALHYEPPWQRQQQQQQQLRMQQLMQHQNSMGAKYYAGGLGSRDPMAMALQQQRARELMTPRPRARGRPPLAGAAPPPAGAPPTPAAGDVVNLDSD